MNLIRLFGLSALVLLVGCGGGRGLMVVVHAPNGAPIPEAQIAVDGAVVGMGSAEVRFARGRTAAMVSASAGPEWQPASVTIDRTTRGPVDVILTPDELYLATVDDVNQVVNVWITFNIGPNSMAGNTWWTVIINAFTTQDFEFELMDAASGFVRTAWRQGSFGSVMVRRRFVGNVVSPSPLQWRARYEVQISRDGGANWTDYDRGFESDIDSLLEVRGRTAL